MKKISTCLANFLLIITCSFAQPSAKARDSLRKLTDIDYKHMLALMKIDSLRQGANGGNPAAPNAANYDESKANPYPVLPDPLRLKNGKKVSDAPTWWKRRRPEIVEDFDREIYGRVPKGMPGVTWKLTETINDMKGNIPVLTKKLTGHVDNSFYPSINVDIQLTLTVPVNAAGPVPVIMEFGFVFPPGTRLPSNSRDSSRLPVAAPLATTWQEGECSWPPWKLDLFINYWGKKFLQQKNFHLWKLHWSMAILLSGSIAAVTHQALTGRYFFSSRAGI
ncbi:MAG: hypothetical protein WKF89_06555 [Chitinophagaceae bacterium]